MRLHLSIMLGAMALTACAGSGPGPQASGPVPVTHDGVAYLVSVASGPAGRVITRGGAVAVQGRMLVVARADGAMGYDAGLAAKAVAEQGCTDAGGRFNPSALGRHDAGRWQFAGACA